MRSVCHLTIAAFLGAAPLAEAQRCPPPAQPYWPSDVEIDAVYIPNPSVSPRPVEIRSTQREKSRTVVIFHVDEFGVPDTLTYQVAANRDTVLAEAGRRAIVRWRYRPAQKGGCRVRQIVFAALEP